MHLLLVRHGIAEERTTVAARRGGDAARELTDEGRRKMKAAARGLATVVDRLDLVASSPLQRARQTASLVVAATKQCETVVLTELEPAADPRDIADWLSRRREADCIALVGHEPHLSRLMTWLVCGADASRFEMKKGAAAMLELSGPPRRASARLLWLLQPAQLRALSK